MTRGAPTTGTTGRRRPRSGQVRWGGPARLGLAAAMLLAACDRSPAPGDTRGAVGAEASGAAPTPAGGGPAPTPAEEAPAEDRAPSEGAGDGAGPPGFADAMLEEALGKDFGGRPDLLRRVRASAHGFYRAVNRSFTDCVCRASGSHVRSAPPVNLHGDAHLEQYAVTDEGRGLSDFDDATIGPALVDLARFATSVRLALRERGWVEHADEVEARLWEGYRDGLAHPDEIPEASPYVRRVRRANGRPREEALAASERLMRPIPDGRAAIVLEGIRRYGEGRRRGDESLDAHYFDVKRLGRLELGIGSALDEKYLFRVEGPTDDPADDLMLEAKEVRSLEGVSCVFSAQDRNPLRIVVAAQRLAYQPYTHAGFYMGEDRNFWIHAWQTNYVELSIAPGLPGSLDDVGELRDVVYDVAFQLGRGHPKEVGAHLQGQLRPYMVDAARRAEAKARRDVEQLAASVVDAWRRFRARTPDPGTRP